MMVGVMGKMGSGKTLTCTILASYLAHVTRTQLWANYGLVGSDRLEYLNDLYAKDSGIFVFDEAWLTFDARMWQDNVRGSQWINQTRKKKMIVFYTTQHIRQIEMRMRNATDILIVCEKTGEGHWLQFIDWQYRQLGRRYLITRAQAAKFYDRYDTYEVLKPMLYSKKGGGGGGGSREYTQHDSWKGF